MEIIHGAPSISVIIFCMADWAGKTLGKVLLEDLVARGGMAEVYLGTHESFGQVAVKVMRGLLERDTDQLARFQREAEVIGELRHANIVRMYEYAFVDESPYLVMEYVSGPSLASYLKTLHDRKQRLPIGAVAHLLSGIAAALDYAHAKGMIHRDIKPANVLLRSSTRKIVIDERLPKDVEPILTDFGLVRLLDSTMHTTVGSVSGTPTYMSPEQARGEKVDKRTDIYSLGIMLYEMIAGAVPFQADTTFGMLMKHINEPPPAIKGISSDMQALLDRALSKDPSLRYETAGAMANEFMALFNGQTISPDTLHIAKLARQAAEERKASQPPPPERPSRRWIRIGVEVAVALILAFIIIRFVGPTTATLTATPVPTANPNIPIGRMRFSDSSLVNDRISFLLTNISQPEENTHYEVWLIGDDNQTIRDVGRITFDDSGGGQLVFTDPQQQNLLQYGQIQITREQNDVPVSKPTGEVVYSSIFPSQALVYVRYVELAYDGVPDNLALMQGLYYYSGSYINTPINGDAVNDPAFTSIIQAYENQDEATIRKATEMVINQIVGDASDQYKDYDQDEQVDVYSSDGYGSFPNGDHSGYIQETALHTKNAADATDSTPNIREQSGNIQICIQNMDGWTDQILSLASQLNETPFGPEMKPIIDELSKLGNYLVNGVDTNGNGIIDPIEGECGADKAYEYGRYLADFPIYVGPDRIPPSGK